MTKKYFIPQFLLLCLFITSCGEANYEPQEYISTNLNDERIELSKEIFNKLKKEHYLKNFVNEDFNKEYIEALIKRLDENKLYFLKPEINEFYQKANAYDGRSFDIDLSYSIINLYFKRLILFSEFQISLIEKDSFNLQLDDYIDIYYEDNELPQADENLKKLWRDETKNDFLVAMMSDTLSEDPKKGLIKRYKNRIRRIQQQNEEDVFSIAVNSLANQFDPHSSYLSPRSAEDFDMNMSLKLEGIGALLGA